MRVAFVEDEATLERAGGGDETLPVAHWVLLDGGAVGKRATTLEALEALGDAHAAREPDALAAREAAIRPDDPAVVLYTSGTTGRPKGAVLTHRNLVANSVASVHHLALPPHPVGLAFLPLAHSYQRQAGVVLALLAGAVAFSSPARLSEDLPRVRPTLLPAVPRLYERLYDRVQETVRAQPRRRQRVFAWAEATAREYGRLEMEGAPAPLGLRARHALCERLVYRRIRRTAGLDRLDLAITGAAAMRVDLLAYLWGIGVRVVEGYGLTETAAPATVNPRRPARAGTVGPPLPGVEVAIATDGEVLLRGPNVFVGYDGLPAETRESFADVDGERWLLTGDVGVLEDGYLRIVDRKKELEVLDTGKKVAPLPVEERLKASPLVAEAVVVAHGRKFVGCLVQPDYARLEALARGLGVPYDAARTRRAVDVTGESAVAEVDPTLVAHPAVLDAYAAEVARANEALADHERVKAFRLLASALSADRGELTPTLKKRRRAILESRRADVAALFARR